VKKRIQKEVRLSELKLLIPHRFEIPLRELRIAKKIGKPHICKNCGKPFKRSYPRTHDKFIFCSQTCHNQWKKTQAIMRKRKKVQKKLSFQRCAWCQRKIADTQRIKFCNSQCGMEWHRIRNRIFNTFWKPQIELKRLQKLGCSYTFPKPHKNFNGFYNLPRLKRELTNGLS